MDKEELLRHLETIGACEKAMMAVRRLSTYQTGVIYRLAPAMGWRDVWPAWLAWLIVRLDGVRGWNFIRAVIHNEDEELGPWEEDCGGCYEICDAVSCHAEFAHDTVVDLEWGLLETQAMQAEYPYDRLVSLLRAAVDPDPSDITDSYMEWRL